MINFGALNRIQNLFLYNNKDEVWLSLVQELSSLFPNTLAGLALWNTTTRTFSLPIVLSEYAGVAPLQHKLLENIAPTVSFLHIRNASTETERLQELGIQQFPKDCQSWLGLPLLNQRKELQAILYLQSSIANTFSVEDEQALVLIAGIASLGLTNLGLIERESESRQHTLSLIEMGRIINSTLNINAVFDRIFEQLRSVVSFERICILLTTESYHSNRFTVHAYEGFDDTIYLTTVYIPEKSPLGRVLYEHKHYLVSDIEQEIAWGLQPLIFRNTKARSWLGVPMIVQGDLIGIICLEKNLPSTYDELDIETVNGLAQQASIAVENARLHQQAEQHVMDLQKRTDRLDALHRFSNLLSSTLDSKEILEHTCQLFIDIFEVDHVGVVQIRTEDDAAIVTTEYPPTGIIGQVIATPSTPNYQTLISQIKSNRVELITATNRDYRLVEETRREIYEMTGSKTSLFAPLSVKNVLIGSISLDSYDEHRVFSEEERDTLLAMANQMSLAIYNGQLFQQAIVANRLKSEFLANISHELRTPLNAILGYTEMLLNEAYGALNDKQKDRLTRVNKGGNNLLNLINDVLDLSKIEAGQEQLHRMNVDVLTILTEVMAVLNESAHAKELILSLSNSASTTQIYGDSLRLQQVFMNLVSNAIKFTSTGTIQLILETLVYREGIATPVPGYIQLQEGEWLLVRVKDTGIGIRKENLRNIFEAFRQEDGSTKRMQDGIGLGLTICQRLVQMHEGVIWADSDGVLGSEFFVALPITLTNTSTQELQSVVDNRPLIILLDDDSGTLQLMVDYLSKSNYRIKAFSSPLKFFEELENLKPSLVISDIMMPIMDGLEVLQRIKDNPLTQKIPVVICSILDKRTTAFYLGASDYLAKPFSKQQFLASVAKLVKVKELTQPILVLDDRLNYRTLIREVLETQGYHVKTVSTEQEVLAWLQEQLPSLVVLDLMIPNINVFNVLKALRAQDTENTIPVLVASARPLTTEEKTQLELYEVQVLNKQQMNGNSLLEQVRVALNRKLQN
jgi:signal transduction histidine kinase/DNA-binding response OmpR family regulator